jgi:FMN phosphatase YigB (HAD superfamily)
MKHMTQPIRWEKIRLVVFDLDGTLYNQRRLRARVALPLLYGAMQSRTLKTLNVLRVFRHCREVLGEKSSDDFISLQFEETAMRCGCSVDDVRNIVGEWIEQRPLKYLMACRYRGVQELFEALHRSGRIIAIFSDYPAEEKLKALGLRADLVVSASDADVLRLKPDPAGLHKILKAVGVEARHSLMVGDRFDRDWAVANRVGMPAIIRSRKEDSRCATFRSYSDAFFKPVNQKHNVAKMVRREGHVSQF